MAKNTETEKIQNVLSTELNGKVIISKPFDFETACLVDDMRYSTGNPIGYMHLGKKAVSYMFRGTELTDEVIETLDYLERKRLCEEAAKMYFAALSKNKSDPKNE